MKRLLFDILLNDKFTAKMKQIAGTSENSVNRINRTLAQTKPLTRNLDQLERKLIELNAAQKRAFSVDEIKRYNLEIKRTEREIAKLRLAGGINTGGTGVASGRTRMMGGMGASMIGIGALYGGVRLTGDITQTTAKYERFHAVLKNTYQDQIRASVEMANLTKFASKTPFQIDELTDSFIKLTNAGLAPTMDEMTNLGDLAASQGKRFDQLSEALLDAQMGEFERLKEFGIKGSTSKDSYKFIFKGQTTEVKKSSQAVKEYILSLGKLNGVQGGMNAISKTTGGTISNLADNWDQLKATIGEANSGVIKNAIGGFSSLVEQVKEWYKVPLSQKLQEEKAGVNSLVTAITSYNVTGEERNLMIKQLQEQYPDFLGNLDAETVKNKELLKRLDAVNASYEKKIRLQAASELKDYNQQNIDDARVKKMNAITQMSLLDAALKGDMLALNIYNKNSGFHEKVKIDGISKIVLNKRIRDVRSRYEQQIEDANQVISSGSAKGAKYSALEQAGNVDIFLSDLTSKSEKLSKGDLTKLELLKDDLKDVQTFLVKGISKRGGRGGSVNLVEKASGLMNEINALFGGGQTNLTSTSFSSSGIPGSGVDQIAGEKSIAKNLIINIDKLVEGGVNIETQTLKEGVAEASDIVLQGLLTAVNNVNGA